MRHLARRCLDCGRIGPIAATDRDGHERERTHRDPPYAPTHWYLPTSGNASGPGLPRKIASDGRMAAVPLAFSP